MTPRWELGLAVKLAEGPDRVVRKAAELGFASCQVGVRDPAYYTDAVRDLLRRESEAHGVRVTALWAGWPGRVVWDNLEGPATVGLVPPGTRRARADLILRGADWAAELGIATVITHLGFVPEDANDPRYAGLLPVLREIARHCAGNGQTFAWETGQETPVTLLRTLEDTAEDNVGVNFDPANLLLYGKGNPLDALELLGPYVRGVHVKDGGQPAHGRAMGEETVVDEGRVDFPALLRALARFDYRGALCVECEFTGERQIAAIRQAKARLEAWMGALPPSGTGPGGGDAGG